MDVLCQAKSGMGKTAVFVLSSLHQLEAKEDSVGALVLCHTREVLARPNPTNKHPWRWHSTN